MITIEDHFRFFFLKIVRDFFLCFTQDTKTRNGCVEFCKPCSIKKRAFTEKILNVNVIIHNVAKGESFSDLLSGSKKCNLNLLKGAILNIALAFVESIIKKGIADVGKEWRARKTD